MGWAPLRFLLWILEWSFETRWAPIVADLYKWGYSYGAPVNITLYKWTSLVFYVQPPSIFQGVLFGSKGWCMVTPYHPWPAPFGRSRPIWIGGVMGAYDITPYHHLTGDLLGTWKVEAVLASSCQHVKEEIRARVDPKSGWHDPHNGGAGWRLWRLGRLGEAVKVSGPSKETNSKFG